MMKVKGLKIGTKLVWDAPEPYEGYTKSRYDRDDHRLLYPVLVVDRTPVNDSLEAYIKTSKGNGVWMSGEEEYLRKPTKEELNTLDWEILKD